MLISTLVLNRKSYLHPLLIFELTLKLCLSKHYRGVEGGNGSSVIVCTAFSMQLQTLSTSSDLTTLFLHGKVFICRMRNDKKINAR